MLRARHCTERASLTLIALMAVAACQRPSTSPPLESPSAAAVDLHELTSGHKQWEELTPAQQAGALSAFKEADLGIPQGLCHGRR